MNSSNRFVNWFMLSRRESNPKEMEGRVSATEVDCEEGGAATRAAIVGSVAWRF